MPIIEADPSEFESNNLTGTHPATVVEATPGTSGSGNSKLVVKFTVNVAGKAITRTSHIPTGGKGIFRYIQFLNAIGMTEAAAALKRKERYAVNTDDMIGKPLNLAFELEPDQNGEERDTIKSYLKAS